MPTDHASPPTAREVRAQMRDWRRGRAELRVWEVLGDAYVALFTVVMVGSMAGSVVVNLRRLADSTCVGTCAQVRDVAPWLTGLGMVVLTLAAARLLGPVFSPPAMNGWVVSSPVDRGDLLRPALGRAVAVAAVLSAGGLLAPAVLGGLGAGVAALYVLTGVAASAAAVAWAARSQVLEDGAARVTTWLLAVATWLLLGLTATGRLAVPAAPPWGLVAAGALVATVAAVVGVVRVDRALAAVSRRVLARTEHLSPSLSGALSSLDLGLMYDVLLARRWGTGARVTTHRGGPSGWWALVERDARRVLRAPQPWLVLAGMALVPYAAAEAGSGRATALVVTLGGLLAGPALCSGLRVVTRTDGLARMLPFTHPELRSAHLIVPGVGLLAYAAGTVGALAGGGPADTVRLVLACGVSALAASARWVTAAPPDYAKPLVSTPAGGVPTGLMGSLFRGLDVWLLSGLPLLFPGWGAWVSLSISGVVLVVLVSRGSGPKR